MAGGRQSYFAEKRGHNNDPNFFNRISIDEIRKNVRRIIKDIRFDIIQEQDYNYFFNRQIIQACICEAQESYNTSVIRCNALNFYINECLSRGIKSFPSTNLIEERGIAANEQIRENMRAKHWYNILQMFIAVSYGNDPLKMLMGIKMIDVKDVNNL